MPEEQEGHFLFYDMNKLPSWVQYSVASKSLLKALDLDNPEETLMVQFTLSELSVATFGLIALVRMFPEFTAVANALSDKIQAVGRAQDFLRNDRFDERD